MKSQCCNTGMIDVGDSFNICTNKACNNYFGTTETHLDYSNLRRSIAVSVFLCATLVSSNDFSNASLRNMNIIGLVYDLDASPISFADIENELRIQNIICKDEVMAQIKIESGNLSSYLFKRTNNMLGMRYPGKRQTKAIGLYLTENDSIIYGEKKDLIPFLKSKNYAVYSNWKDGIADYKLWQDSNFKVREKYLEFLGNNYAEDSLYISKIKAITKQSYSSAKQNKKGPVQVP